MTETIEKKIAKHKKTTAAKTRETPAKAGTPKVTCTFQSKSLEEAFVHFLQLIRPEPTSQSDCVLAAKRLLQQNMDFISHQSFSEPTAEAEILGDVLFGTGFDPAPSKGTKAPDLPAYLARLCEAKLLTPDEEKSLFHRMNFLRYRALQLREQLDATSPSIWTVHCIEGLLRAADWYRDLIVKSNMRLVISIVKKFVNPHNGFDDLLSDGIMALMRAVDKFDVGLGFRFSTYATQVVRRHSYRRVMEKQAERQRNTSSIHENGIDIGDDQKVSSMTEDRWNDLRSKLSMMLDHLDRREKFIIRARFSLGGHRRIQTLQRLADKLGVSKERVRQLEKRALDKLRGMAENTPLQESD